MDSASQGSSAELRAIIDRRQLRVLFQPVVELCSGSVVGYEALIRGPSGSPLHSPLELFGSAARHDRTYNVESIAQQVAIEQFKRLDLPGKLFLNHTLRLMAEAQTPDQALLQSLETAGLPAERVVLEIREDSRRQDYTPLRRGVEFYRARQVAVAVDDVGAGYAGLRLVSELRPDWIKMDRHLVEGMDQDSVKQDFARSILDVAQGMRCEVIAQGIETQAEFATVYSFGVRYGQGHYFARPLGIPPRSLPAFLFDAPAEFSRDVTRRRRAYERVETMGRDAPAVLPSTTLEEVGRLFREAPKLGAIAVVEDGRPLGILRRFAVMQELDAHQRWRKPGSAVSAASMMDPDPLVVEYDQPLEQVSQIVTDSAKPYHDRDFLIARQGRYLGVGQVVDLLKRMTQLQARYARHCNPLTSLPGRVPLDELVNKLLTGRLPFRMCHCDLDHFRAYNQTYGYGRGDKVILALANLLVEISDADRDMVGHLGGDEFVVIFRSPDWAERCRSALARFETLVPDFYGEEDLNNGGIWAEDSQGSRVFYPLLSISMAVASPDLDYCRSHYDVAALMSEAKASAKRQEGNVLLIYPRPRPAQPDDTATVPRALPR